MNKEHLDKAFRYGLFVSLVFALGILYRAVILRLLWAWFVVPATGFDGISLPVATGLSIIISLFTLNIEHFVHFGNLPQQIELEEQAVRGGVLLIHLFIKPTFLLLFGWIVQVLV